MNGSALELIARHDEMIGRHDERLTAIEKRQAENQGAILRIEVKLDVMKNWAICSLGTGLLAALSGMGVLVVELIRK